MAEPPANGPSGVGHRNAASATLTAILDRFSRAGRIPPLADDERLDGRHCLITGASSGLGKAIAIELARRGASLVLACRSGIPDVGLEITRLTGNERIEMLHVDLSDLESVHALADRLAQSGRRFDVVMLNAGLMAKSARRSAQGYEIMFAVHFLANRVLLERLLSDRLVVPHAPGDPAPAPRIIFVTSESHRSSVPIDFEHFGEFVEYGIRDGMKQYASSKLHMCTLASELSRRVAPAGRVGIAVHALCPGPVDSNIAREAPGWLGPVISFVFGLFFQAPDRAAEPAVFLACSRGIEGRPHVYLHMMREKSVSPEASDPENGRRLMAESDRLLARHPRTSG